MAPPGFHRVLKRVFVPKGPEMEGRGLIALYERGKMSVAFATIYCPVGDRNVANHRRTEKLLNWVRQVRQGLSRRTQFVMGVDANGHVGEHRQYEAECIAEDSSQRCDEYFPIGPFNPTKENENGALFRKFLKEERLAALNTWQPQAAGHTWVGGAGQRTRVDDIVADERHVMREDLRVTRAEDLHRTLRHMVDREAIDHVPLCWAMPDLE